VKRYRLFSTDFDSIPMLLADPKPEDPELGMQWEVNRAQALGGLAERFGSSSIDAKVQNYIDFGRLPLSVVAYHNLFIREIQAAFVIGGYYPALTKDPVMPRHRVLLPRA
jgi:hypothetical protein